MRSAFDWISRVVMLVLAGLVSLSIIGALASISSDGGERATGIDRAAVLVPEPRDPTAAPEPEASRPRAGAQEDSAQGFPEGEQAFGPAPPGPADPARWLEAIAYALLALAGIAAFGVLLLWRVLAEQRRIANALEALAHRA